MIKIIFSITTIITSYLFSFQVQFQEQYQKILSLSTHAFSLESNKTITDIPFKYFKVKNRYILIGDGIDEWIRNTAYLPQDTKIKEIKVNLLNVDKLRINIINKLNKNYKNCSLKKIDFLNSPKKIYLKPTIIKINTKVTLECK